jgi:hypothetical protein
MYSPVHCHSTVSGEVCSLSHFASTLSLEAGAAIAPLPPALLCRVVEQAAGVRSIHTPVERSVWRAPPV